MADETCNNPNLNTTTGNTARNNPADRSPGNTSGRPARADANDLYDDTIRRDDVNAGMSTQGAANTTGSIGDSSYNTTTGSSLGAAAQDATAGLDPDRGHDANRDPLSGAPGAHPVGAGVGAAGGGLAAGAAAGFVAGTVAGPVGSAVGAVAGAIIGGVAGGYAGKGVAEAINPTAEDAYWRDNYTSRPYVTSGESYDNYRDAYEYGWTSRGQYAGRSWTDAEPDLRRDWETRHGAGTWQKAKDAVKDSWDRVTGDDTNRAPGSNQSMSSNNTTRKDSY